MLSAWVIVARKLFPKLENLNYYFLELSLDVQSYFSMDVMTSGYIENEVGPAEQIIMDKDNFIHVRSVVGSAICISKFNTKILKSGDSTLIAMWIKHTYRKR